MSIDSCIRGTSGIQMEVKAASVAPVAADQAGVVTLSPNMSTLATALCKVKDVTNGVSDTGVAVWGVRRDVPMTPVSAAGDYTEIPISGIGCLWVTNAPTAASIGYLTGRIISAATTNATLIKALPGQVFGWSICNNSASWRYLKLFNKATAPVPGTDSPLAALGIPPGSSVVTEFENGIMCSAGIGFSIVGGIADLDATAVGANEVAVNLFYK